MRQLWLVALVIAVVAVANPAQGAVYPPTQPLNSDLQTFMNSVTVGGTSSVDFANDMVPDSVDSIWETVASGIAPARILVELAGFAPVNRFGIYDVYDPLNTAKYVELFPGSAEKGASATFEVSFGNEIKLNSDLTGVTYSSQHFGFWLDSTEGAWNQGFGGFWFSDSSLNDDESNHMFAYEGPGGDQLRFTNPAGDELVKEWTSNSWILAWEDLDRRSDGYDGDFTDLVVLVESVTTVVPEPATLGIWSVLAVGGAMALRRRRQRWTKGQREEIRNVISRV